MASATPTLTREAIQAVYPLTSFQEGALFHDLLEQGQERRAYFQQLVFRIRGPLDVTAFEAAWNAVIARHDSLRTLFRPSGGQRPMQLVLKQHRLSLLHRDLSHLPLTKQEPAITQAILADQTQPFDLTREVPLRMTVLQCSPLERVVIWSFHHILMDGWCISLLQGDLAAAYAARTGGPAWTPEPAPQLGQYLRWLGAHPEARNPAFWQQYLDDYQPQPLWPRAPTVAPDQPRQHQVQALAFSEPLSHDLRQLASSLRCTLGTLWQALWGLTLARWQDWDDCVFGWVTATRPVDLPGAERILGPLINTLPVRLRLSPEQCFADWVTQIQQDSLQWQDHRHVHLAEINPGSHEALFDHFIAFENYPKDQRFGGGEEILAPGIVVQDVTPYMPNNYRFSVAVYPDAAIRMEFSFDAARIDPISVQRLGERLRLVAQQASANPQRRLLDFSVLTHAERRQLETWSQGAPSARTLPTIAEWLETRLAAVLQDANTTLNRQQLQQQVQAIAWALREHWGIQAGQRVAVLLAPGVAMVSAMLACLRLGAAFVPLDPKAPVQRITHILGDSQASLLIQDADQAPALTLAHTTWAALLAQAQAAPTAPALPIPEADPTAYLIYTSGTTGQPKGVCVGQQALLNYTAWLQRDIGLGPADCGLLLSSPAFDLGYTALFGLVLNGGRLIILSPEQWRDPEFIIDCILREEVSFLKITPSLLDVLLRAANRERLAEARSLQRVFLGGEPQSFALLRQFHAYCPWVQLFNHYGPTEATIGCIAGAMDPAFIAQPQPVQRIGRPIAGAEIHIVDRHLQPVAQDSQGELLLGGEGLAQGYQASAGEIAAARFVTRPGPDGEPRRYYRSGDYGYWLEDGQIAFLGRRDEEIKIRGYRVDLAGVADALRHLPGVRDAAVLAQPLPDGSLQLLGFVVATAATHPLDPATVRQHLSAQLPDYMLPGRIHSVPEIPTTANGKLDRAALLAEAATRSAAGPAATPESLTATQSALRNLWREILGQQAIGLEDDFFALGGHSIRAIAIVSEIKRRMHCELSLADVFTYPRLRDLATQIDARQRQAHQPPGALHHLWLRNDPPATTDTPLWVWLPPTLGSPTVYQPLMAHVPGPLRCLGLFCPGFAGDTPWAESMEALGRAYADAILALDSPPTQLVGWSFGGVSALFTAQALAVHGLRPRLILLDCQPRLATDPRPDPQAQTVSFADVAAAGARGHSLVSTLTQNLSGADLADVERRAQHHDALAHHAIFTGRLSVPIIAIEAADEARRSAMQRLQAVTTGRFTHYASPGDHFSMLEEPNIHRLIPNITPQ